MKKFSSHLQEKLDHLSRQPGVYLFKDKNAEIVYIGKAKVLRNRVRSYFQKGLAYNPKVERLVSLIRDVETIVTDTEVEALILEANLVKQHKPRYNINLKDDKSFPFIRVTNELYPRIFPTRKIIKDGSRYFGPYTDVKAMRDLLKTIKTIFPVRSCKLDITSDTISQKKHKVCLEYHIKKCQGPCEGLVSPKDYNHVIEYIVKFIQGRTNEIERDIRNRMTELSSQLKFESAARLRDQLVSIEMFTQRQKVLDNTFADRDIVAVASDEEDACCVVFKVRDGKFLSKHHFYMNGTEGEADERITKAFIQQFYVRAHDVPSEILIPTILGEESGTITAWLSELAGTKVRLVYPRRGEKAKILKMCARNAQLSLEELQLQKLKSKEYIAGTVKALQQALRLSIPPKRIEGFDISNIQGTNPVASMVCFVNGKPLKKEYRKYKIQSKATPDDVAMMYEAVKRRYSRLIKEEKAFPDLILIDGGKGQLNAALKALNELDRKDQPIISLAKRLDEVFVAGLSEPQNIRRDSAGLKLLQRVRDESHRFAVSFHRSLRSKSALESELDHIPGIGEKRKKLLLSHFGSLANLKKASAKDIQSIHGFSEKRANNIVRHLQQSDS